MAVPDLDEKVSLYGVFDGHGGRGVSAFAARELPRILKETEGWKERDYKKALEQAFVQVDEDLRSESGRKAIEELDKPDPSKPRRLLQVPRRMVERFRQGRAIGRSEAPDGEEGEEEDLDIEGLEDDYEGLMEGMLEGEEEEAALFETDKEVEAAAEAAPALASAGAGVPATVAEPAAKPAEEKADTTAETSAAAENAGEKDGEQDSDGEVDDEESGDIEIPADEMLIDPAEITRSANPEAQGCTAVVVLVVHDGADGPRLICANAGDSRAMVSRRGQVVDLSEDHKPENDGETARIVKAGGFVKDMPGGARVMGDLNLSRAMGDLRYKQKPELPPAEQIVTVFPDITAVPLKADEDEFLVLGCDGIWETNTNQDAVDFVRARLLGKAEPQSLSGICADICDKGLCPSMDASCDGKGCDNMTVMVVQLKALIEGSAQKRPLDAAADSPNKRAKEGEGDAAV